MNQITLNPFVITRTLGALAFLIVLFSIAGQFSKHILGHDVLKGFVSLFYVDHEQNIPTFFSVLLLLFASSLLAIITLLEVKLRAPHASKWAILSFGFLCMAYDEAFSVHERLTLPVRTLLGDDNLGIFYYAWVIPAIALVFVLGLFFIKFLLNLPAITRFSFLIAATIYLGGAIGIELIGGRYDELYRYKFNELYGYNFTYSMIATVEESLEMAGIIVFIHSLLSYCSDKYKEVRFKLDSQAVARTDIAG